MIPTTHYIDSLKSVNMLFTMSCIAQYLLQLFFCTMLQLHYYLIYLNLDELRIILSFLSFFTFFFFYHLGFLSSPKPFCHALLLQTSTQLKVAQNELDLLPCLIT